MKKILFISLLVLLAGTVSHALENTSLRVKGMHEDLANLIEDEYTDFMFLPYNMLDVEGYRLYTNLSNLSQGDEELFSNFSNNQYLIGGVAPILDIGKAGFIYGAESTVTSETIETDEQRAAGYDGLRTTPPVLPAGWPTMENRDGEYEYIDNNTGADTYEREYGKADNTESVTEINVLFAKKMFDNLKLGLVIGSFSEKTESSNEYSYKEDFDVSDKDEFGTITYEESGIDVDEGIELSEESKMSIGPSAEYQVNDKLSIGGGLSYIMSKGELKYNFSQTEHCKMAYLDNVAAEIAIDSPGGGGVGLRAGGGAATSDWIASYSAVMSAKPDGAGFGGRIFAKYSLNENTTLRGIVDFMSVPVTGNITRTETVDIKDDGYSGAGYKQVVQMSGDIDITTAETTLGVGLENKLSENLLLGIGLKYTGEEEDTTTAVEGDIEIDGTKVAYTEKWESTYKQTTSRIILPVGLEYKPNNWLSLRIGASHIIETIEIESTETMTTYDNTVYPIKIVDGRGSTVESKEDVIRTTDFSFGAGIKVTENLQVDIMRFDDLTAMAAWRISATLMF